LRALPALAAMLGRLVSDPALPRGAKIALAAAVVYLASPIDLIPDFIPFLGYVDDLLLAAIVLDGVLKFVDREVVLRYWPGRTLPRRAGSQRAPAVRLGAPPAQGADLLVATLTWPHAQSSLVRQG
jgi:uncharacterized membrane protein YkvA (DUF1232 family)